MTLDDWLYDEKIPGVWGVDTRELAKRLRVHGVMTGAINVNTSLSRSGGQPTSKIKPAQRNKLSLPRIREWLKDSSYEGVNFMPEVSTKEPSFYIPVINGVRSSNTKTVVLIDTGTKFSIIRNILSLGFSVVRLPWDTDYDSLKAYDPVGVVISNGPGDPEICSATINTARRLIEESVPTLGICLGNQILALAAGAKTYKLKYGHRGQNKPCVDRNNNTTYITSQNHGYGIDTLSLQDTGFTTWFYSPDDETIEGIQHSYKPIIGVQFHPEASPGPYDCTFVFERFRDIVVNYCLRT